MERCNAGLSFWIVRGCVHKHADPPHAFGLLRACRKRPSGRGTAQERDELAPFQLTELHFMPASAALQDIELARISQRVG